MIATWMLAATALGLLAAGAALAAERALRLLCRQGRSVWILALVVTSVWPLVAPVLRRPAAQTVRMIESTAGPAISLAASDQATASALHLGDRLAAFDTPLLLADDAAFHERGHHGGGHVETGEDEGFLLRFELLGEERVESRTVDGHAVLVTPGIGPAAFGIIRPRIVLPIWSLELDRSVRALILRHEVEHVASADPAVLVLAWLLTALMPWNLSLWWILRRLRTATELDCDYRVLRGNADTRRYAHLLMLIAQRQGQATFASMIAGSPSTLSQRIAAMHAVRPSRPVLRAVALMLGALIVGGAAASPALARELANVRDRVAAIPPATVVADAPRVVIPPTRPSELPATAAPAAAPAAAPTARPKPAPTRPSATQESSRPTAEVLAQDTVKKTKVYAEFVVDSQAHFAPGSGVPSYPQILKLAGVTGRTIVQFVVDTTGLPIVNTLKVVRSAHNLFTFAVQKSLPDQRFVAARVGGRNVKQLVQVVYRFDIAGMPFTDTTAVQLGLRTLEVVITGNGAP